MKPYVLNGTRYSLGDVRRTMWGWYGMVALCLYTLYAMEPTPQALSHKWQFHTASALICVLTGCCWVKGDAWREAVNFIKQREEG